jgi:hypothetical protein
LWKDFRPRGRRVASWQPTAPLSSVTGLPVQILPAQPRRFEDEPKTPRWLSTRGAFRHLGDAIRRMIGARGATLSRRETDDGETTKNFGRRKPAIGRSAWGLSESGRGAESDRRVMRKRSNDRRVMGVRAGDSYFAVAKNRPGASTCVDTPVGAESPVVSDHACLLRALFFPAGRFDFDIALPLANLGGFCGREDATSICTSATSLKSLLLILCAYFRNSDNTCSIVRLRPPSVQTSLTSETRRRIPRSTSGGRM